MAKPWVLIGNATLSPEGAIHNAVAKAGWVAPSGLGFLMGIESPGRVPRAVFVRPVGAIVELDMGNPAALGCPGVTSWARLGLGRTDELGTPVLSIRYT
ncbi:MAG: hypothetical protein LC114_15405 [Bryobacterales bacterium]|nr:hypothetical protein [Bryobacterales bacterium]